MRVIEENLSSFGMVLKTFRKRRHLTQQQLAEVIGVHRSTLINWEQGNFLPKSKGMVLELARHLRLDDQETRQLLEASLTALSPDFLVPFPRNPFFTGREETLVALHAYLHTEQVVALTQSYALHGLGGIGKTQIALEYAYRYALEYRAVFWVATETIESIFSSLLHIAEVLQLPEREDKDQQRVVAAVQHWLSTHGQWLLIWDNVEDLDILHRFLPSVRSGVILITTRCQALGTRARGLDLAPMEQEEGILFLLRRAKVLEPEASKEQMQQLAQQMPSQYAAAVELVEVLGGLPLALDQAGAYLEETRCGLPAYMERFRTRRVTLLRQRGEEARDHPASVSTTFTLAITATTERHPAVRDLLQVCVLLQPDAIPEELFRQGAEHLGPTLATVGSDPLEWDRVISVACAYSLLARQPEAQALSLHRLVQAVLLDTMTKAEQEVWNTRAIEARDTMFPDVLPATKYAAWKQCERLLPHALLCLHRVGAAEGAEESLAFASLAYKSAQYLRERGRYAEAEPLFQRALHIRQQALGPDHSDVASPLSYLAALYFQQGKYAEAEPLFQRALHIRQQALGPDHSDVARALNNLAELSRTQGKYAEAEPLYQRASRILEQALGPDHPLVASALANLAELHREQGKDAEAEPVSQRASHILEQALGPDHPDVAQSLTNLAELYRGQGKDAKAKLFYQRALHILERALGPDHPLVAHPCNGLANLCQEQGEDAEAEALFQRALRIRQFHLGRHHPETAQTLHDLAVFYQKRGKLSEAFSLAERALTIRLHSLGETHPKTVANRTLYAQLVREQAVEAEPTMEYLRTLLKARGWSVHLKKRRGKPYVYATRKAGQHTYSRYLAPLSNLAACLATVSTLPNAKEQ